MFTLALTAQQIDPAAFHGSWFLRGFELNEKFYPASNYEVLTLYKDSIFQIETKGSGLDTSFRREAGWWRFDNNSNRIVFSASKYNYNEPGNIGDVIVSFTDTSLIMYGYEGKELVKSMYSRIPLVPKSWNTVGLPVPPPERKVSFYLVNCVDSSKRILISGNSYPEIVLKTAQTDSSIKSIYMEVIGSFLGSTDSTIRIDVRSDETRTTYVKGQTFNLNRDFWFDNKEVREIRISDIDHLRYKNHFRDVNTGLGGFLTTMGVLTTMVAAPLVSVRYTKGGINTERYTKWAAVGGAGIAVGVPMVVFGRPKNYKLAAKGRGGREEWYLMQK